MRVGGSVVPLIEGRVSAVSAAAFFDLDRTLMAGSSAYHFGRAMYKAGHMSRRQIARDAVDQIRFRAAGRKRRRRERAAGAGAGGHQGARVVDLARMTPGRAGRHPAARLSADARRRALAPGRGPPCYIATAASQPAAEHARAGARHGRRDRHALGDRTTASTPAASTGPFAYGEGKAEALREFAAEHGIDLEQSWAYTDAASDLPMLEAVGHPVAVNPDAGLAEIARARGLGGAALREARRAPAGRRRRAGRRRGGRQRQLARGTPPRARAARRALRPRFR